MTWISVNEKFPEYDVDVLCCDNKNNIYIAALWTPRGLSQDEIESTEWRNYDCYRIYNVKYWMPLPDAPCQK